MGDLAGRFLADIPEEELPTYRRGKVDWNAARKAMMERPGEWCIVAEGVTRSTVTKIRKGEYRAFRPATHWKTAIKGPRTGRVMLLMMYDPPMGFRWMSEKEEGYAASTSQWPGPSRRGPGAAVHTGRARAGEAEDRVVEEET
jgi:hypothetical protein